MRKTGAKKARKTAGFGKLPAWNLADLYASPDAPQLKADLAWAREQAKKFRAMFEGKLAGLNGKALGEAIARYEEIAERLQKIMSYAYLRYAANVGDAKIGAFFQTMQEQVSDISTDTLFFALELNKIDDKRIEAQFAHPKAAYYGPWVRDNRVFRPHQL